MLQQQRVINSKKQRKKYADERTKVYVYNCNTKTINTKLKESKKKLQEFGKEAEILREECLVKIHREYINKQEHDKAKDISQLQKRVQKGKHIKKYCIIMERIEREV